MRATALTFSSTKNWKKKNRDRETQRAKEYTTEERFEFFLFIFSLLYIFYFLRMEVGLQTDREIATNNQLSNQIEKYLIK